jgi:hypothetical protein
MEPNNSQSPRAQTLKYKTIVVNPIRRTMAAEIPVAKIAEPTTLIKTDKDPTIPATPPEATEVEKGTTVQIRS